MSITANLQVNQPFSVLLLRQHTLQHGNLAKSAMCELQMSVDTIRVAALTRCLKH